MAKQSEIELSMPLEVFPTVYLDGKIFDKRSIFTFWKIHSNRCKKYKINAGQHILRVQGIYPWKTHDLEFELAEGQLKRFRLVHTRQYLNVLIAIFLPAILVCFNFIRAHEEHFHPMLFIFIAYWIGGIIVANIFYQRTGWVYELEEIDALVS